MKKLLSIFAAVALLLGLASCDGDLHQEASVTIVNSYDNSEVTITGVGGSGVVVDGSPFSWNGGSAVTLSGFGPDYKINATADNTGNGDWVSTQTPFTGNYPTGADSSMKLKFGSVEGWICYKKGGSYTFAWTDKQ